MKIIFSPHYTINLKHKFKTFKFEKTVKLLLKNKIIEKSDITEPQLPTEKDLLAVHSAKWVGKLLNFKITKNDILMAEMPINRRIIHTHLLHTGGTILASKFAFENGIGIHCGGGSHHAHRDYGAGFCLINDIAVAVKKILNEKKAKRVLIIDLDVHQGDGTAEIFKRNKKVFTFSMHQKEIYPLKKEKSSMDIELPAETSGDVYLKILSEKLEFILKKFKPDFMVYNAGADVYKKDRLGGLKLSLKDIEERDKMVFLLAHANKIPLVLVLSGGYARNINDTVQIHYNTIKQAIKIYSQR